MRPTIAQLEAFYWIARLGSVKEAARHLNLAQPTVSLRLQDLEDQFQRQLFERGGRRLALTSFGEAMMPRTAALLHELTGIRTMAEGTAVAGVLRIGLSETFAQVCLPHCLRRLAEDYPAAELDITIGTSAALEQDVLDRALDLAFVINPVGDPKLAVIQLGIQDVAWAAAPGLVASSPVTPAVLENVPIITNPHPSPMYRQIIDWFREDGIEPARLRRCTSVTVATELVCNGLGASLLPVKLIERDLDTGRLVQLQATRAAAPSRLYCIYRFADQNRLIEGVVGVFRKVIVESHFLKA
jgi:DNA-binding transcriptional LysR family regulator